MESEIKIEDYSYDLPEDKIAIFPLEKREKSKILIFENDSIKESIFSNLPGLIPTGSLMVFNNTKVIPARLIFRKESGARIEIFCLEPFQPADYYNSFASTDSCKWVVGIGNAKRWKSGEIYFDSSRLGELQNITFKAILAGRSGDDYVVEFRWRGGFTFSQLLEMCGSPPIPPYLKREAQSIDKERYQTVYAERDGSVAAPTAGLHFTDKIIKKLDSKGINRSEVVLHVGAGTFRPVKSINIEAHIMHSEPFTVSRRIVDKLLEQKIENRPIVAVGTTSARAIESLFYIGVNIIETGLPGEVAQWTPYERMNKVSVTDSLKAVIEWMEHNSLAELSSKTEIIIVPGYEFKLTDILITNFHQPKSTLLLLIAAFIGGKWRDVYRYALDNEFRFLSYGDSSILFKGKDILRDK